MRASRFLSESKWSRTTWNRGVAFVTAFNDTDDPIHADDQLLLQRVGGSNRDRPILQPTKGIGFRRKIFKRVPNDVIGKRFCGCFRFIAQVCRNLLGITSGATGVEVVQGLLEYADWTATAWSASISVSIWFNSSSSMLNGVGRQYEDSLGVLPPVL